MSFHPCVILDFRPRNGARRDPANRLALEILSEAGRLVDLASDDIQAGLCNAEEGRRTSGLGGVANGRTLSVTIRASLELMNLSPDPANQPLREAMEEWLYQRGNGNG